MYNKRFTQQYAPLCLTANESMSEEERAASAYNRRFQQNTVLSPKEMIPNQCMLLTTWNGVQEILTLNKYQHFTCKHVYYLEHSSVEVPNPGINEVDRDVFDLTFSQDKERLAICTDYYLSGGIIISISTMKQPDDRYLLDTLWVQGTPGNYVRTSQAMTDFFENCSQLADSNYD